MVAVREKAFGKEMGKQSCSEQRVMPMMVWRRRGRSLMPLQQRSLMSATQTSFVKCKIHPLLVW
eukprot:6769435-Ditylum_brightwellii.AAC.1